MKTGMIAKFSFLIYLFVLLIFYGCFNKTEQHETANLNKENNNVMKTDSAGKDMNAGDKVYEGLYIFNKNENIFRDCNYPDSVYWIIDDTKKIKDMYEKYHSSKNVYSAVMIKIKGDIIPSEGRNNTEKYPRTIRIKEIVSMEKKNFRNTCIAYDFWGLGNEPNWSLQISRKESQIEFYDYSEDKIYNFFYEEPKTEGSKIYYTSHNKIQRNYIDIIITKELCTDTMSDTEYEYSVEIKLNKSKNFKGCAVKGK